MERVPCPHCKIIVDCIHRLENKSKEYHMTTYMLMDYMRHHLATGLWPVIEAYTTGLQSIMSFKDDEINELMAHFDRVESDDDIWGPQYYHFNHLNNRFD